MEILHVILHEVVKDQMSNGALNCRDEELPIVNDESENTPVVALVEQILDLYDKKHGKGLGVFEENTINYPFSRMLGKFLDKRGTSGRDKESISKDFVSFTKSSMTNLLARMDEQQFSTGGYVLYSIYNDDEGNPFMCIAMLRNKQGSAIDENLNVMETIHLDLDKLHICCQVDVKPWRTPAGIDLKYLSFIKGRVSSSTPEYFLKFIGCAEFSDSRIQTNELTQVVKEYCKDKQFTTEESTNFRRLVYDYCKSKLDRKERVFITDLSHYLDEENPESFLQFVNQGEYEIGTGFEVYPNSLKKLQRISGGNKEIRLAFEARLYGNQIRKLRDGERINARGNTVVINNIPENLLKALEELDVE